MVRGPAPKRSEQRIRRNKYNITKAEGQHADMPDPDPEWHPIAIRWYDALPMSGQSQFYQASDWAQAWYVADLISKTANAEKPSAQLVQAILSASNSLLTTEGARRQVSVELTNPKEGDSDDDGSIDRLLADAMAEFAKQSEGTGEPRVPVGDDAREGSD